MTWSATPHVMLLLGSAVLAAWSGFVAHRRRTMPGSQAFAWAMFAVAYWTLLAVLHATVGATPVRIRLAQVQYIGIVAVAPLWLIFGSEYARVRWLRGGAARSLVWAIPLATLAMAFTNDSHRLLWTSVEPITTAEGVQLVYHHGPWFWIAVAYNYMCLSACTILLFHSMRRFPLPYRRQTTIFLAGALLPWLGNALYVSRILPPGVDLTPVGFAFAGAFLLWGFYRHRLFDLVPIARDLVVESMDQAVIVLDPQRYVVDFNPAAERIAGCSIESIGRPIDHAVAWWTEAIGGESSSAVPSVVQSGANFLEIEVKPVRDGHERFAGWLVLARDVSTRRQADAERREFERHVQEQQRLQSLTVLAGGVAHDFNNLLTGILGNAELLALETPDPVLRKSADAILIGAQRAADLVAKMLAYAGEGRVIAQPIDLDALIREMHDLLQASVARHCTLTYESTGALPPVTVDPTQIRQVVMNLIINAAEAVDDGGIVTVTRGVESLDARTLRTMTFSADAAPGAYAYVQVADNGPGMDDATLARIFDPFFSTKQGGRGLGLAAVQGIVRSHRGALRVRTRPGDGTTIQVWFPMHMPSASAVPA